MKKTKFSLFERLPGSDNEKLDHLRLIGDYNNQWKRNCEAAGEEFNALPFEKINGQTATLIFPNTFDEGPLNDLIVQDAKTKMNVDMVYCSTQNKQIGKIKGTGYDQYTDVHFVVQVEIIADLPCKVDLCIGEANCVKSWLLERGAERKEYFNFSILTAFQNIYIESTVDVPHLNYPTSGRLPKRNPQTKVILHGVCFGLKNLPIEYKEHLEIMRGLMPHLPPIFFPQSDLLLMDVQGLRSDGSFDVVARYQKKVGVERERDRWRFKEENDQEREFFIYKFNKND